ncbi:DMT family transporter [Stakelama tenebrarum]|uniref:DMT family transporter n=1 Tax=Stakelama tenebrarum TaxID=2711215 RepID=A0A6G6Y2K9_9SPHN|nr:DMT family transporter [Sphingosinithalassobacter tenebrarum]QIG79162.1 DMT family transporter [Sphingosinithalassobacter tenebrarum]
MTQPAPDRILAGIALRLLAIFCLASMAALIKLAESRGAGLVEALFFRQLFAIPLVLVFLAAGAGLHTIRTQRFGAHLRRTIVGLIGMVFNFGAVILLPLAEATTFQFTVPIFATILGALLLKEPTGWHRWGAVIAGFLGVLIVAQPGSAHIPLSGAAVGLTAAFLVAIVAILLRQIGQTESAGTTVFWFSTLSMPILIGPFLYGMQAHDPLTWAILVGIGLVGGAGQIALTAALRYAPVSVVVPMDYSSLIWATLYGWLLFGMLPSPYTWLGAPVIIASGLYIVWRERLRARQESAALAEEENQALR